MNYDHYIALDWSQRNMAVARLTGKSNKFHEFDVKSDVREFQYYLCNLKGSKILTFESTDTSQWLYTEFKNYVDKILVCDPYRNYLLTEGSKTDLIDARKLVKLLRADMLKPVYHSGEDFIYIRRIVSAYEDVVKGSVRTQNQRFALYKSIGKKSGIDKLETSHDNFIISGINKILENYDTERKRYEQEFKALSKKHKQIRLLKDIPGIGLIGSVKIVSRVVDAKRFRNKYHFWSYCGLIKLEKISGGKSYGKKNPRCCRTLKSVFKTATVSAIRDGSSNELKEYYDHLIEHKKLSTYNARNAVSRRIAALALGVLRTGKKYEPYRRKRRNKNNTDL